MSREPTKHQLSSRLSYQQHTPNFLRRLQKNYGGGRRGDEEDEDDEPTYGDDDEFEDDGSGRPPIPVRPPIPERPKEDPGSGDEDVDEKPQVVVLKEGKHLTEREAENEKRKGESLCPCSTMYSLAIADDVCAAQGLPPLPEPSNNSKADSASTKAKPKTTDAKSLNFSSAGSKTSASAAQKKRKAVVDLQLQDDDFASLGDVVREKGSKPVKKKPKKTDKKLLSFGDDA